MADITAGQFTEITNTGVLYTSVSIYNPLNGTGIIDTVIAKSYVQGNFTFATFYGSAPAFTSRDSVNLGTLTTTLTTYTGLEVDGQEGDFVGGYHRNRLQIGYVWGATLYISGSDVNWIDGQEHTYYTFQYNKSANYAAVLYAEGETVSGGTVAYDGNGNTGGTVPVDENTYEEDEEVTVLGNTGSLVKTGYTFAGWNTAADGSGTDYAPAATFAMGSANVTLYAQWTEETGDKLQLKKPCLIKPVLEKIGLVRPCLIKSK